MFSRNLNYTIILLVVAIGFASLQIANAANEATPQRFLLRFSDAYLVYEPGTKTLQIAAQGTALSYGKDWRKKKLKSFLYHFRQKVWKGF